MGAMNVKQLDSEAQKKTTAADNAHEPHESPITMTLPLMILAVPSFVNWFGG
jgi:NAD(P)H-quinone oxidoreductase subunit 5